jgi:hypothetical protein
MIEGDKDMTDPDGQVVGAAQPVDERDMANLDSVRQLYEQLDPMPDGLIERVNFTLALEHLDAEVAKLADADAAAGVRSIIEQTEQVRTIIFEASSLTVMISVSSAGEDRVRVDGWLSPEGAYRVELRTPDTQQRVVADEGGRFVIESMPRGLFRLVIRVPERQVRAGMAPVVITPSVVLD